MHPSHPARIAFFPPVACPVSHQRGVVLVVALIMLLLLTLIGIAGLRDTQLQERMAGGAQDRELALQAAEAALREAESQVADGDVSDIDTGAAVKNYDVDDPADLERKDGSNNPVTEVEFWRDQYDWIGANNSIVYGGDLGPGVASPPRYVIEQLPVSYSAVDGSSNIGEPIAKDVPTITDYLITVRATGSSSDAVVILQSQYRYVYYNP